MGMLTTLRLVYSARALIKDVLPVAEGIEENTLGYALQCSNLQHDNAFYSHLSQVVHEVKYQACEDTPVNKQ